MKTCKYCKKWNEIQNREGYGYCQSDKLNRHPNYYEDNEEVTELDMVEIACNPITGKDFGCVHHIVTNRKAYKCECGLETYDYLEWKNCECKG